MQCGTALFESAYRTRFVLKTAGNLRFHMPSSPFPQTGLFNRSLLQSLPVQQMFALLNLIEHSCLFLTVHICILSRLANACVDRRATERERLNRTLVKSCPLSEAAGAAVVSTYSGQYRDVLIRDIMNTYTGVSIRASLSIFASLPGTTRRCSGYFKACQISFGFAACNCASGIYGCANSSQNSHRETLKGNRRHPIRISLKINYGGHRLPA